MKIKHKYLRNRHFHIKNWKRIRNQEHPFQTCMPYGLGQYLEDWDVDSQIKRNFESIDRNVRALESGYRGWFNAPSNYRRMLNKCRKSAEREAMAKIRQGDYEVEVPIFKKDANWLYF